MVVDIALLREVYGFGVGVESRGLYIRPELAQVRAGTTADVCLLYTSDAADE